jgi:DNA processing protein
MWSFRGVGAKGFQALERLVPRSEWFDHPLGELGGLLGLKEAHLEEMVGWRSLERRADHLVNELRKKRIRVCFRGDPRYPKLLSELEGAPPLLFYQGPGATAQPRGVVAIVGTRKTAHEWLSVARTLAADCCAQGLVVTSGAAEGIDTAAHRGALSKRGVTWAFVASGLDELDEAPRQIVDEILPGGGSVFTEYPPGTRADKGLFVQRNRLISGSAGATVMVRGDEASGARHTAEAAYKQGRRVLACPTMPLDRLGGLERVLLRGGARPCFDVGDVLASLGLVKMRVQRPLADRQPISDDARLVFDALPVGLFDMESAVAALPQQQTGAIAAALMELELAGWVVQRTGRRYEKQGAP